MKATSEAVLRLDLQSQVLGVIGAESNYTGSMRSPTPSTLMIQEIDPTVKIWPCCGRDEEPTKRTILFDMETTRTPLPSAPTVDSPPRGIPRR